MQAAAQEKTLAERLIRYASKPEALEALVPLLASIEASAGAGRGVLHGIETRVGDVTITEGPALEIASAKTLAEARGVKAIEAYDTTGGKWLILERRYSYPECCGGKKAETTVRMFVYLGDQPTPVLVRRLRRSPEGETVLDEYRLTVYPISWLEEPLPV